MDRDIAFQPNYVAYRKLHGKLLHCSECGFEALYEGDLPSKILDDPDWETICLECHKLGMHWRWACDAEACANDVLELARAAEAAAKTAGTNLTDISRLKSVVSMFTIPPKAEEK